MKAINNANIKAQTRFLDTKNYQKLFIFDKDITINTDSIKINMLDKPTLLQYYLSGWKEYSY